ncbi:hypothetical protein HMPREF0372_02193, partial [Flavonifractor plautii ATCC 29863]
MDIYVQHTSKGGGGYVCEGDGALGRGTPHEHRQRPFCWRPPRLLLDAFAAQVLTGGRPALRQTAGGAKRRGAMPR